MKNTLLMFLAALMLIVSACGESGPKTIHVKTAKEFIEALGSNRTIIVDSDIDDVTSAISNLVSAGKLEQIGVVTDIPTPAGKPTITATDAYEGPSLNIISVENLTIEGGNENGLLTSFIVDPSYANVLAFFSCKNITIKNLLMGHKVQDGCSGDVVHLETCSDVNIESSELFGCGVIGLYANNSQKIKVSNSSIYDCSHRAVELDGNTSEVFFSGCRFLMIGSDSPNYFGENVKDVSFHLCEFDQETGWYAGPVDPSEVVFQECTEIIGDGDGMEEEYDEDEEYSEDMEDGFSSLDDINDLSFPEVKGSADDQVIKVQTADGLLSNIGSNRTIIIENDILDFTETLKLLAQSNIIDETPSCEDGRYVFPEGTSYTNEFDGPSLWISNVQNLKIVGKKKDTHIQVDPAYANVFGLSKCKNITFENLKLGHKEQGNCVGDVLHFDECADITINNCKLYGCGVIGLYAEYCNHILTTNTEIYDCSESGIHFDHSRLCIFGNCKIYDVPRVGNTNASTITFEKCNIHVEVDYFNVGRGIKLTDTKYEYDREPECAL